jgi:hypothetical protein
MESGSRRCSPSGAHIIRNSFTYLKALASEQRKTISNAAKEKAVVVMPQMSANAIEYRGYTLTPIERAPGWWVYIYPGPHLLQTQPDHVSAATKEEAFTKARAVVDRHLLGS